MPGSGSVGSHSVASIPVAGDGDTTDTPNELLITFTVLRPVTGITRLQPAAAFNVAAPGPGSYRDPG